MSALSTARTHFGARTHNTTIWCQNT